MGGWVLLFEAGVWLVGLGLGWQRWPLCGRLGTLPAAPATDEPCALSSPLLSAAVDYLATRGYDPAFGARPVKRVVQQELETALAKGILRGDFAVSWQWHSKHG